MFGIENLYSEDNIVYSSLEHLVGEDMFSFWNFPFNVKVFALESAVPVVDGALDIAAGVCLLVMPL